ncbi:MAG: hypothetical protein IPH53_04105 [Flavobacteriales bacterium]|nr:hypothetical protein [Flavobacteriales bacterium]
MTPTSNNMSNFKVKYQVGNVQSRRTLKLQGGTESEAIAKLKQQSSVPKEAEVVVLSIEPA